jgi:magnesium and cobalt transporter
LDEESGSSGFWHRFTRVFHGSQTDSVEQAIREASQEGELDQEEGSMLLSVLTLDGLQVQDILTPRTDIACVPNTATIKDVAEIIIETGHSRIPLYKENRDNIIGIVYAKDILRHSLDVQRHDEPAIATMREPFFVPETKKVLELLHELRERKTHLAVILDEYGGTAGLVSIEDVMEVIVGDIEDEHDAPREEEIITLETGGWRISGRAYLEDIAERTHIMLESEDVDTLGGYLSHQAGRVPRSGEKFPIGGMVFIVEKAGAKQIHSVRVIPESLDAPASPGHAAV